jgi:SagB-type dehydrogenase family enzyme
VSYWQNGERVYHNYATAMIIKAPADMVALLDFLDDWHTAGELAARTGVTDIAAQQILSSLAKATLLEAAGRSRGRAEAAMATWEAWNPSAGMFHMSTRDTRFLDPLESDRLLSEKARHTPPPPPIKRYRRVRCYELARVRVRSEFPRVLLNRRTWRQFSKAAIPLHALGWLLGLTGGVHHWASLGDHGDVPLKTSPSGGARHPIELYVCARRVEGLPAGLYHYDGGCHRLNLLASHRRRVRVQRYLPTQFWYEGAAALVFFTAVTARYLWKYTYARAYRALLIEAGHQCQTFCLSATWLGLAPFCSMALADSRIERDLGLDGISETVLYAAGVGVRPSGVTMASKPAGYRPLRVRPNPHVTEPPVAASGSRRRKKKL